MSLFLLCLIPPTSEPFNSCSLVLRFPLPFFSVAEWKELLKTEKLYELKEEKKTQNKHGGKKGICTGLYLHEPTSFSCHVLAFARVYPSERSKRMFWSASRTISSLPYLAKWNCRLVQPAERESTAHSLSGRGLIPGLTSHSSKHCLSKATHANAECPLQPLCVQVLISYQMITAMCHQEFREKRATASPGHHTWCFLEVMLVCLAICP